MPQGTEDDVPSTTEENSNAREQGNNEDLTPSITLDFKNIPRTIVEYVLQLAQQALDREFAGKVHNVEQRYILYPNFFVDKVANGDAWIGVSSYERCTHDVLPFDKDAKYSKKTCWNCGDPGHEISSCRQPRDPDRIREARIGFMKLSGSPQARRFFEQQPEKKQPPVFLPPSPNVDSASYVADHSHRNPPLDPYSQQYQQYYQQMYQYYYHQQQTMMTQAAQTYIPGPLEPPLHSYNTWQPPPPIEPPPVDVSTPKTRTRTRKRRHADVASETEQTPDQKQSREDE